MTQIYIGNIPKFIDQNRLETLFCAYGKITEINYPIDRKTEEPKGYGFITFAKQESAERALEKNGDDIEGQTITVEYTKSGQKPE